MKKLLNYANGFFLSTAIILILSGSVYADLPVRQGEYTWLNVSKLQISEDWHPDAWYRKEAARNIQYDLTAGIRLDSSHPVKDYAILLAEGTSETERFAAEELQKYLYRITGRFVPVVNSSKALDRKIKVVLQVGNQLDSRLKKRAKDDFVIVSSHGKLVLSGGGGRGTLYSVYSFLEKYMGCRWYYPDPEDEVVPRFEIQRLDGLLAEGIDEIWSPAMEYRESVILNTDGCLSDPSHKEMKAENVETKVKPEDERRLLKNQLVRAVYQIDWMAKNRYNTVMTEGSGGGIHILPENWDLVRSIFPEIKKRGLRLGVGGHFLTPYLNTDTPGWPDDNSWGTFWKGKRHPVELWSRTYFCTTDHNAVTAFLSEVVSFFRHNPEFDICAIWPPDDGGAGWCECPNCSKIDISYRSVKLYNQIAEALNNEAIRPASPIYGKSIPVILLGYSHCLLPPKEPMKLQPNFVAMPDVYRNFSEPYTLGLAVPWKKYMASNGDNNKMLMFGRWGRSMFTGYHLLPPSTMPQTIKNLIKEGFSGVEMFHGWGGWWVKGICHYATAKAMWNPDCDLELLIEDYFDNYFGVAAAPMRTFYQANEQAHARCPGNFVYMGNYDHWFKYVPISSPGINPDEDKAFPGILEYLDTMLAIGPVAEQCFAEAEKLAAAEPDSEKLLDRIRKAKLSWEYFENQKLNNKYQFDGLLYLEQAYNKSTDMADYLAKLNESQKYFEKAQKCHERFMQLVKKHTMLFGNSFSADEGVFWDGGATQWSKRDYSDAWLGIVRQLHNEARGQTWPIEPGHQWKQRYPQ